MLRTCLLVGLLVGAFGELTDREKQMIVDMHNDYRRQEGASDMTEMVWSEDLAKSAENAIAGCHFGHLHDADVGENLAASFGYSNPIEEGIKGWYDEKEHYTYYSGCEPGQDCGHYTQVVWANSNQVGCAVKTCSTLTLNSGNSWNDAFIMSCRYLPRGNYQGQLPYQQGPACSQCGNRQGCNNGLCTDY